MFCRRLFSFTIVLLWLTGASQSIADDQAERGSELTKPAASKPNALSERVLLLNNGKVIKGVIQQGSDGYIVSQRGGSLVLTFDQVRLDADDIEDAYRQQRHQLPAGHAEARIELARWCMTNGLPDLARVELRDALKLDPMSRIAQNMMQRITDQQLKTKDPPSVSIRDGKISLLGNARPLATVDALGGLPREAALEFMSKVQPLLVNRCATAGCHGPGFDNSFELQRVKAGKSSPKSHSERNLAAILERLDRDQPLSSPLLVKLRGETNTAGIRQSHGGLSYEQMQSLRRWIESISTPPQTKTEKPSVIETPLIEITSEPDSADETEVLPKPPKPIRSEPPPRKPAQIEPPDPIAAGQSEPTAR